MSQQRLQLEMQIRSTELCGRGVCVCVLFALLWTAFVSGRHLFVRNLVVILEPLECR